MRSQWRWVAGVVALMLSACAEGPTGVAREARVVMSFLTPATVRTVVVEVSGPGLSPAVVLNIPVAADSTARDTLMLTAGAGRRFVVTALDSAGVTTHRADTTITLQAGANTPLAMRLEPLPSTLGITVTFGGVHVTLADSSTRVLVPGDTVRLEANAVLADGTEVPTDSLLWGSTNPAIATVTNGLVQAVREGNTAVTVSYRGATARLSVSVESTPLPFQPSGALIFNGSTSYLTMAQSFLDGATVANFTLELWVKNGRTQATQTLVGKVEFWKEWALSFGPDSSVGFFHAWPYQYYGLTSPSGVLRQDVWQHIALVGLGTTGSMYIDGVLVHQASSLRGEMSFKAEVSGSTIAGVTFGFSDYATLPDDNWFLGEVADLRVWDRALAAHEIASLHRARPSIGAPGLRHWIPFNEGSGGVARDIIGGLEAQVFNATWRPTSGTP